MNLSESKLSKLKALLRARASQHHDLLRALDSQDTRFDVSETGVAADIFRVWKNRAAWNGNQRNQFAGKFAGLESLVDELERKMDEEVELIEVRLKGRFWSIFADSSTDRLLAVVSETDKESAQ